MLQERVQAFGRKALLESQGMLLHGEHIYPVLLHQAHNRAGIGPAELRVETHHP